MKFLIGALSYIFAQNNFPHLNISINFNEKAKPFQRKEIFVIIFYF